MKRSILPEPKREPERPPARITQGVRGRMEPGALGRPRSASDWLRRHVEERNLRRF
ncbi:MAG TPA: hypothetical protein VFH69_01640 [Gemmatimonadota bacterium]|nr:hypothetical protein [Gemmatimonadota bacterium]